MSSKWHKEWNYRYPDYACCAACKHFFEEPVEVPFEFTYHYAIDGICRRVKPKRWVDKEKVCDHYDERLG